MHKSVLFITNAYPDFETSSHGIFVKKMTTLLKREGYEITILAPKIFKKSRYVENQNGIKIFRFPFLAGNKLLIEYEKVPYLKMILYYLSGLSLSCYLLFKGRFDLIHVHWAIPAGPIGILDGFIFKKPVVVTVHGSDFRRAMERKGSVIHKIFMWVCRKATHIHCVSMAQLQEIKASGIREHQISVIPMGVEESFIEVRQNDGRKRNGPPVILSNRNLLPIYNVIQLVRAIPLVIRENPNMRFIIVGDGPEKNRLENEARTLNVESYVKFLGHIPHHLMPKLLSKADIYVSTSLYDGTSVSLLEAMGTGVFPVVSDIPANREWIQDGKNGLLFSTNDVEELARKILWAVRNEEFRENARKVNQSIVDQKALWPVCIEKIKIIYCQLGKSN